eukprot:GFKZ01014162.1.p1 GENE.GFKZ01014162.1~~GFKZ01014162.1.p1  ORF type:complete len:1315 (+),score=222.37 GFKZ01014162.1:406-4350(+)
MAPNSLRNVLEKMSDSDSDYRYMAASDLNQQLSTPGLRADADTQRKLCRAVMKLLKDANSEVQGMAMKCIPALAYFVDIIHTSYIVEKLLDYVLDSKNTPPQVGAPENIGIKAMRDVSALSIKAILARLQPESQKASVVAKTVCPRLFLTIRSTKATGDSVDVLIETFELLNEVLNGFGSLVMEQHDDICDSVLRQLPSQSTMITKRATACLGALATTCSNHLFSQIVDNSISDLKARESKTTIRTAVQIFWVLSKRAGHRLAKHVENLAPILFELSSSETDDDDDELREQCVQTLGSFCLRCKQEMLPFGGTLSKCLVSLAKYDPNYIMDDEGEAQEEEEEEEEMGEDPEDSGEDFEDGEDYSDDDDTSWKVRRASIRAIHAAISTELLPRAGLFDLFGPFLVGRFREREESVKIDVFNAFAELLRLSRRSTQGDMTSPSNALEARRAGDAMAVDVEDDVRDDVAPLIERAPQVIKNLRKELVSGSSKSRTTAMSLLRELVDTIPAAIIPLVGKVVPEIEQGLRDSSTAIKTESLLLLKAVVRAGGTDALVDHIQVLIPRLLATTDDKYYKVTAECLRCSAETLTAFGTASAGCKEKLAPFAPEIHDSAKKRATAQDQDSEVKEAALDCLGATVSYFGHQLGSDRLLTISPILVDRLANEVTRLSTLRALHIISQSDSADVLWPVMGEIAETAGGFLRKNNAALRAASLKLLSISPAWPDRCDSTLIQNASELISDSDLGITRKTLILATRLIRDRGAAIFQEILKPNSVYSKALAVTSSPLLQGGAVEALIEFFRALSNVRSPPLTAEAMIGDLTTHSGSFVTGHASISARNSPLHSIARCTVAICDAAEPVVRTKISKQIIHEVSSTHRRRRIFSLACLGEFGRGSAVMKTNGQKQNARDAVLAALDAPEDDVRTAAALAFGGLTAVDGASGLATLVDLIKRRPEQKYLLLLSLKDAISSCSSNDLAQLVNLLLSLLMEPPSPVSAEYSEVEEITGGKQISEHESVRTATAECLGLLAQVSPELVSAALVEGASSFHTDIRESSVAAVKLAVSTTSNSGAEFAKRLKPVVLVFIRLIEDSEVTVAKSALQAVNAIAKSRPSLLIPHIAVLHDLVFSRLKKNKDFVRIVDLGPFKHEEDYGLDMRKAAFDCMRTFVSGPLRSFIQLTTLVEHTLIGLADHSDVRAIAQLILATAAATPAASELVSIIGPIVNALDVTFSEKVKTNAVRQEAERHEESIRGALRAVRMLERIPEVCRSSRFQTFMASVVRSSKFAEKYESIGKSDVELMTFGGMNNGGSGLAGSSGDVVMVDK